MVYPGVSLEYYENDFYIYVQKYVKNFITKVFTMEVAIIIQILIMLRSDLIVKSVCCSCKGPEFNS